MSASKGCDGVALLPGCAGEQSDAVAAYTQADLGGYTTWITLPRDQWPETFKGIEQPVVRLRKALYGHPKAGDYWEKHCHAAVQSGGWRRMPSWECMFVHEELQLVLSIYVDDFKMAGIKENLAAGWKTLVDNGLVLDPPTPLADYLGVGQAPHEISEQEAKFLVEGVRDCLSEAWWKPSDKNQPGQRVEKKPSIRGIRYINEGFIGQCVDRYCELAQNERSKLKRATTPSIDDHAIADNEFDEAGQLKSIALNVVMEVLYSARGGTL